MQRSQESASAFGHLQPGVGTGASESCGIRNLALPRESRRVEREVCSWQRALSVLCRHLCSYWRLPTSAPASGGSGGTPRRRRCPRRRTPLPASGTAPRQRRWHMPSCTCRRDRGSAYTKEEYCCQRSSCATEKEEVAQITSVQGPISPLGESHDA